MKSRRRVRAAGTLAAAFFVACVAAVPARADDGSQWLFFSGIDAWRDGQFGHGGLLWSPGGLDYDGLTVKIMAAGGIYRYRSGALGDVTVRGIEASMQMLPGWRFKFDRLQVTLFGGLDVQGDVTFPYDPSHRLQGYSYGARAAIETWYEPTPKTMVAADAFVSSIDTLYSARLAFGWKINDWFYLGPEAQTFDCQGYRQLRVGLHLTALKTGPVEWSAAIGWSDDSDGRSSPYVRLGIIVRSWGYWLSPESGGSVLPQ
jgi:Cellulose biosynthesis protein BcsS